MALGSLQDSPASFSVGQYSGGEGLARTRPVLFHVKLSAPDDSQQKQIIPVLHDARLVTMHGNKMLSRGLERAENGTEYAQELSVMVTRV